MNFVEDILERYPASKPALVTISPEGERRVWHFGELIARAAGLSGAFAERGVGRGDVVMTLAGNRIEWVLSLVACWRMGAVALPCTTQLRRGDLEHRVEAANPALAVGEDELLAKLPGGVAAMTLAEVAGVLDEDRPQATPAPIADLDSADPALIVFTSGTTGEPRGAVHGASYLEGQRTQAEHWLGARDGELVWCTTASGWSKSARNVFLAPWLCGAAALMHDARFDPAERLEICAAEKVNVLCQSPTEYRVLAARGSLPGRELPYLRRAVSAGEPLDAVALDSFRDATGIEIADGYGQTETGHLAGNLEGRQVVPGSMGQALPGIELRVANTDGGEDGVGELQLRAESSPTFFRRYLDGSESDVRESLVDGEWWQTGDDVRRDADGNFFYAGRRDDMILSAGYRIGPAEVEAALLSHPAVAEAAAVPAPDPERGSVVRAVVVVRDGREQGDALARELQEHVKSLTAPYKYPRIVEFAGELPRTPTGKLRRAALRQAGEREAG